MKAVRFAAFGAPHEVCACAEVADPGEPAAGEVVVAPDAFPINPVDLITIRGDYATRPELPATPGSETAGRVVAVGEGVSHLATGDRALLLSRENWAQRRRVPAEQAIKLPDDGDPLQYAMLKINPPTAYLMLNGKVALGPGDWVIQNAANSAVGRHVIRLAKAQGLHTVNVVRRAELVAPLEGLGADVVLVDGDDLGERVQAAAGGADIRLGIDAVAGAATGRLGDCLGHGATILNYGVLTGLAARLTSHHLLYQDITLKGFWLVPTLEAMGPGAVARLYGRLGALVADGTLHIEVEAAYDIGDIKAALEHAAREGRSGKILILPNGPLDE